MNEPSYNPGWVEAHFDSYGMREWDRLVRTPVDEINLHIHKRFLRNHIQSGMSVLEIGAGAGRFTQVLAELGARITVGDISAIQLEINQVLGDEHGFGAAVDAYRKVDICNLKPYADDQFDAVVVFGGPFSYALDRREDALAECVRVLKADGNLLSSVMSLWGSCHKSLPGVMEIAPDRNRKILLSGDLLPETVGDEGSYMHLFRVEEYQLLLEHAGLEILQLSASGVLGLGWSESLSSVREDPAKWEELLEMEVEASKDRTSLSMGTHLIAAARKYGPKDDAPQVTKVSFQDVFFRGEERIIGGMKQVEVPFHRMSARALVFRRKDGAVLGTQHKTGAKYALPGGAIEDGESAEQAVRRELDEENICMIQHGEVWQPRIDVDYYAGYEELSIWYVFLSDEAEVLPSFENVITRWVLPEEDVWHPTLRDRIRTSILRFAPKDVCAFWLDK